MQEILIIASLVIAFGFVISASSGMVDAINRAGETNVFDH